MPNRFINLLFIVMAGHMLAGCTTRAWYEAMKGKAKQECLHQPPSEQTRCESNLNKEDFETYEKNRSQK
jgi:hypothetical protein